MRRYRKLALIHPARDADRCWSNVAMPPQRLTSYLRLLLGFINDYARH